MGLGSGGGGGASRNRLCEDGLVFLGLCVWRGSLVVLRAAGSSHVSRAGELCPGLEEWVDLAHKARKEFKGGWEGPRGSAGSCDLRSQPPPGLQR